MDSVELHNDDKVFQDIKLAKNGLLSSTDHQSKNNVFPDQLLATFFTVSYYFGITPFKFRKRDPMLEDEKEGYVVHQCTPQKVLCALVHFTFNYRIVVDIVQLKLDRVSLSKYPQNYIMLFANIFLIFRSISFFIFLFWKRNKFEAVMDRIWSCSLLQNRMYGQKLKWICVLHFLTRVVLPYVAGYTILEKSADWSPKNLFTRFIEMGKANFFLTGNKSETAVSEWEVGVGVGQMWLRYTVYASTAYLQFLLHGSAITLWVATRNFVREIKALKNPDRFPKSFQTLQSMETITSQSNSSHTMILLEKFEELKKLASELSDAFGVLIFFFVAETVLLFAVEFDGIVKSEDLLWNFLYTLDWLDAVIFLLVAALSCARIEELQFWLLRRENRDLIPSNALDYTCLLNELSSKVVALNGLFKIDFKFLGNLMTLTVTYFIIMLQFQQGSSSTEE